MTKLILEISKFANWIPSAKSAKYAPLDNYPLYGKLYIFGERSEPRYRVFNDQPRDIYIHMVVSLRFKYACACMHERLSIIVIEIQVLRNGRLSSVNNRSSGISNIQSSCSISAYAHACVQIARKHTWQCNNY